jgi:hypothetical protein
MVLRVFIIQSFGNIHFGKINEFADTGVICLSPLVKAQTCGKIDQEIVTAPARPKFSG